MWCVVFAVLVGATPDVNVSGSTEGFFAQAEVTPWVSVTDKPNVAVGMLQVVGNVGYGVRVGQQHRLSVVASWRPSLAWMRDFASPTPVSLSAVFQLRVGVGVLVPSLALFSFGDPWLGLSPGITYRLVVGSWLVGAAFNSELALTPHAESVVPALGDGAWLEGRGLRWGMRGAITAEYAFDERWSLAVVLAARFSEHQVTLNHGSDDPRFPPTTAFDSRPDARGRVVGTWAFHQHVGLSLSLGGGVMERGAGLLGFGEAGLTLSFRTDANLRRLFLDGRAP